MCLSCAVWQRNDFGTDVALVIAESSAHLGAHLRPAMCLSCEVWQRNNFGTDVALVIAE